ncbi:diaminopimelate decarboxylase [Synechococcus elongatus]|uniref:diaminopimelate decarboxylase n=1 Tax=Synechococcus elongatus TaxID=32046 RepID=UPI000F7F2055|nr:diaminopimelate decarboxylase [Synechococcus elongatus]
MVSTPAAPSLNPQYPALFGTDRPSNSPNQNLFPLTASVTADGQLEVGGCRVSDLVERYGSPLYILDEQTLRAACQSYRSALAHHYPGAALPIYASKAWNCLAVCALVAQEGLGIDVVSAGELYTALQAGVPSDRLYFHGNNKSLSELAMGVEAGCTIVVDNWQELRNLEAIAAEQQREVRVMIRFTPGIECHTHEYIRTGHLDSKFGFDPDQLDALLAALVDQPYLRCIGLHAHIGSQIFELQPHADLAGVLVGAYGKALALGLPIAELNVGGGLGIRYTESDDPPSIDEWVRQVSESLVAACQAADLPLPKLICEPGRSLIGTACVTAYQIGSRKEVPGIRTYLAVDGGMSDNPRPITYQSTYRAVIANRLNVSDRETVTVAGKHCESGDVLLKDAELAPSQPGDILVVLATGAYNYSMASNYNRIARPAAVLVNNGEAQIILARESLQDLLRQDRLPVGLQA